MQAASLLRGDRNADAGQRLGVYVEAYALRLLEVLQDDYSVLRQALGAPRFDALADRYIAEQASTTHSIRWFGRHLPDFLRQRRTRPAWAAELARFEWLLGEVLDAADAPAMTAADMAAIAEENWPRQVLSLAPSVRMLRLAWNAPELLQARESGAANIQPLRHRRAQWCLLWRHDNEARWRQLPQAEAWALRALQRRQSLAAVGSTLQRAGVPNRQVPAQLVTCLRQWLADGLICAT